ncbi:PucR family transcriptional regulator [Dactylosporangium sp. NPDC048998]|uniref:PucR family transcriptional regulator n=1 Tax=Dactylosporangium sp. NPDC048998 TaxID=3363976 RepID=UPI0037121FFC
MTGGEVRRRRAAAVGPEGWLQAVAQAAGRDAGAPAELLGDYLQLLAEAAVTGRRPRRADLDAVGELGRRAARQGVSAGRAVQLYLSAARRLWQDLPAVVRSDDSEVVRASAAAVLQAVDEAVATLAEGYAHARRDLVRREEALRRELVDDLLRGDSDPGALVQRAEPFGVDPARGHRVALAAPSRRLPDTQATINALEAVIFDRLGDRDVLVATKDGLLVVIAPAEPVPAGPAAGDPRHDLGHLVHTQLSRPRYGRPWQVTVGRAHPGLYGIARSYEEAREALAMVKRLRLDVPVVNAHDLLVHRVLLRDQPAIVDLVGAVLGPLTAARGGAEPLLDTLRAYFATGEVATEAAKQLRVSVRTVTYRLARIRTLTGYDPADPDHRFTLQAAVRGAAALNWPANPLPTIT